MSIELKILIMKTCTGYVGFEVIFLNLGRLVFLQISNYLANTLTEIFSSSPRSLQHCPLAAII
jgi:hypothetical protein